MCVFTRCSLFDFFYLFLQFDGKIWGEIRIV